MMRPEKNEYAPFYARYVELVTSPDGIDALQISGNELTQLLEALPAEKGRYRYEAGKWSINELVQHLIDSEIIFASRVLRIGRGDKIDLPGFEQDDYVAESFADYQNLNDIIHLFKTTRALTIALMQSLPARSTELIGSVSGNPMSVRALCYIISGHGIHHTNILKERYL